MKHKKHLLALALLASVTTGSAQASLVDRGNGLLYDDVLNVTWLQDANYAHTSGYALADSTGAMDWTTATTWATNLNYNGLTGWRLATNTPINGSSFNYNYSSDGTTDFAYNITSPKSELAYMYNVNLGLKDEYSTTGSYQPDFGVFGNGTNGAPANVGLVKNLSSFAYWSGAEFSTVSGDAWILNTYIGLQYSYHKFEKLDAWAVRPGDVAAIPEPAAVWLFGSGLLGLLGLRRRVNIG